MSKKQILKNIQKEKKNKKNSEEKDTYFKFITTLAVLLLVFVLAYFLIGFFYTKEIDFSNDDEEDVSEVSVDNSTIMLGQLFDQSEEEYYVLIYDTTDKVLSISSWMSIYSSKSDALKIYTVDSSKKFNANYLVEEGSNKDATSVSELRVISPTLIKVTNKAISEYIEGEDNIVNVFKGN